MSAVLWQGMRCTRSARAHLNKRAWIGTTEGTKPNELRNDRPLTIYIFRPDFWSTSCDRASQKQWLCGHVNGVGNAEILVLFSRCPDYCVCRLRASVRYLASPPYGLRQ